MEVKYFKSVQTIDKTIKTLYSILSAEADEIHNWELFLYLFHPEGKMIQYANNIDGLLEITFMSPKEYVNTIGKYLDERSFYEKEIYKKIDTYGSLAHVLSTYQSYRSKFDKKPYFTGLNSFQLVYQHRRWWIINNFWTREAIAEPFPKEFLQKHNF